MAMGENRRGWVTNELDRPIASPKFWVALRPRSYILSSEVTSLSNFTQLTCSIPSVSLIQKSIINTCHRLPGDHVHLRPPI